MGPGIWSGGRMGGGADTSCPWGPALEEGSAEWSELAKATARGSYGKVLKFLYRTGFLAMDLSWRRQEDGTSYHKAFKKCSRWNTYFIYAYIDIYIHTHPISTL